MESRRICNNRPILRDTILPNWLHPKTFMTKREVEDDADSGI